MLLAIRHLSLAIALAVVAAGTGRADTTAPAAAEFDAESLLASLPPDVRQQLDDARTRATKLFTSLRESAAPRDWAIASQFVYLDAPGGAVSSAERAALLRNAAAADPEDALVQWMAATAMPGGEGGCSAPALLPANYDALMRLESDNGLAWLPALHQSWQNKDALAVDSTLARMAAASRFDDYRADYLRALVDVAKRHPESVWSPPGTASGWSADELQFQAAFIQAQMLQPPIYTLFSVCDRAEQPDVDLRRFSICADVGRGMVKHARSAQLRQFGLTVINDSGHYGPEDRDAERELAWLQAAPESTGEAGMRAAFTALRMEYLRSGDEIAALRKAAIAAGQPAIPPPAWQPSTRIEDEDEADAEDFGRMTEAAPPDPDAI
ncbi:MAG TPA: hypothetical protein VLF18_16520 [Tahibacter sp.]|uniref:hypothetical protein n=1 Tax=Tahibacter sp. TaxID=2056211 RepID=UPI002CFF55C2|nr:hypothetical protein [Tahibacter sp.]HSX61798.1 hypothetical protein [Tahibacter sp.]